MFFLVVNLLQPAAPLMVQSAVLHVPMHMPRPVLPPRLPRLRLCLDDSAAPERKPQQQQQQQQQQQPAQ